MPSARKIDTPTKRGRQKRTDPQISVTGEGVFSPPGSFEWFPLDSAGSFVPKGSSVKLDSRGKGGIVDGIFSPPGTLIETLRKPRKGRG